LVSGITIERALEIPHLHDAAGSTSACRVKCSLSARHVGSRYRFQWYSLSSIHEAHIKHSSS